MEFSFLNIDTKMVSCLLSLLTSRLSFDFCFLYLDVKVSPRVPPRSVDYDRRDNRLPLLSPSFLRPTESLFI